MTIAACAQWLALLADPARSEVQVENAVHDVQPPTWRHAGSRVPGHVNWLFLSNGARMRVVDRTVRVEPGSWLCLAPGVPVWSEALHPGRALGFLRFRCHVRCGGREAPVPGGGFLLPDAADLQPLVLRLIQDVGRVDAFAQARQRGYALALYGEAFRRLATPLRWHARGLDEAQLRRIDAFVAHQLPRPVTPAALAQLLGMRPDTFSRAFHRALGRSPRTWLAHRRIQYGADLLLQPGASAVRVAATCGYADVFHFCRQFRQHLGCGTRAWRQRHGLPAR